MTGVFCPAMRCAFLAETPADHQALTEATRAVVLRCHEAWLRRDVAGVLACYHPDIDYVDYSQNLVLRLPALRDYVAASMPGEAQADLRHIDRIRADGDTAFIQYEIAVPFGAGVAQFHASEAITVQDGLIRRIRDYAILTRAGSDPGKAKAARGSAQRLGLSARQLSQLAGELDGYFERSRPYLDPALDLAQVAQATGYTRNQISYLLNQVMGLSFYQYVTQKRLSHLMTAIDAGADGPVDEAAFAAGFNSLSAFYRAFRQRTGTSPAAYRRELGAKTLPADPQRRRA